MKKFLSLFVLSTTLAFTTPVLAASDISVYVDGTKVAYDAKPMIGGGSTLVPLRQTFEALGADVVWDNANQTITAKKDDTTIKLTIGYDYAYKNDDILTISSSPIVENNRTYVPLRFVAESFGAEVSWNGSTQTVTIKNNISASANTNSLTVSSSNSTTESNNNASNTTSKTNTNSSTSSVTVKNGFLTFNNKKYDVITVAGGDLSGTRKPNVAVDIGFGDRVYWGLTNEYGQLVYVLAEKITLQDDSIEKVNSNGRYFDDEAKVPGVERSDLDEGHVIADSLGGVSNAYNITPQNSTLNRYGDQAYFEKNVRDAGGCTNFVATINYPNTTTQIPSNYHYEYTLMGNKVVDDFNNTSPETTTTTGSNDANSSTGSTGSSQSSTDDISKIDTNGNGQVSVAEAKAAGFSMPITSSHWLYKYMTDGDGDGKVGE